jgi:serine/threonine protein kinase
MVPQVGQRIGPYEILGRLGSGGMGLVFSAWDARLHRDVAIKILRDEFANPDMRSRFLQEARAASGLNHPNICTIFDIGEQEGDPFLVMELLKGETLRQRMNAGNFQVRDLCRIGHECADALSVAHARGIIHRDVKPANIFIVDKPGGGYTAKVLDFGLAKIDAYGSDTVFDLTNTGTTVGTVNYMSPEQARGEALDPRSDLFSLGVLLYEMAAGRLPFQGATPALVFVELLSKPPDTIRPQNPQIPEDLEHIILKLLEKDRTLRYQSGAQLMEAIDNVPFAASNPGGRTAWDALMQASGRTSPSAAVGSSSRQIPAAPPRTGVSTGSTPSAPVPLQDLPELPGRGSEGRPRRVARSGSSAIHRAAVPTPETPASTGPSADEVIRPVHRVVSADSSSAFHRAAREPAGAQPSSFEPASSATANPVPDPPAAVSGIMPVVAPPSETRLPVAKASADPESRHYIPASRPIIPQSARTGSAAEMPAISLPRIQNTPRPAPRFSRLEEIDRNESRPHVPAAPVVVEEEPAAPKSRLWLLPAGLVALVLVGLASWKLWPSSPLVDSSKVIPLMLGPVNNATGDNTLSGVVSCGIAFDLSQSPQFIVEDVSAMRIGLHAAGVTAEAPSLDQARESARAIGATEILTSDIRNNGGSYTIAFHVNAVDNGTEMLHGEETAQSREQIPDAIDRLVIDLRTGAGESNDAVVRSSVPLAKDASSNLDALQAYANGAAFQSAGQLDDAAAAYEKATSTDPHFPQAFLRLADMYSQQHADVAAAAASVSAQSSASTASDRTQRLATASYNFNATGNLAALTAGLDPLLASYPNAVRARIDQANALRLEGKYSESYAAIEGALRREPYNVAAVTTAQLDLIGQERPAAAKSLEDDSVAQGRPHPGLALLTAFLLNNESGPIDTSADVSGHLALGETQAALLDATGSDHAALQVWRAVAVDAGTHPQIFSAAADALSSAAMDRALTDDCTAATTLIAQAQNYPQGVNAQFRIGLAAALCGDLGTAGSSVDILTRTAPQSFFAKSIAVPEIKAVVQWKNGNPAAGLQTLQSTQFDLVSLTPYLRGQMHLKANQPQAAIADFQFVLQHPGAAVLVSPVLYAVSQLGQAHAYAASGDTTNSASGYNKFLTLWSHADPGSPLLAEAHTGAHR